MWRTRVRLALCAAAMTAAAFAQYDPATFITFQRYPGNNVLHPSIAADLNTDGAVDFVLDGGKTWLSNGDGTYRLGTAPSGVANAYPVTSGDFDGDGKADVVFSSGNTGFLIAYGNGDGTWRTTKTYAGIVGSYGNIIQKAVAADFNKDGKQDLAVFVEDFYGPHQKKVGVLINTGTDFSFTGFAAIEYAFHNGVDGNDYEWMIGDFALGDFDADGKADVAYSVRYDPVEQGGQGFAHLKAVALFGDGAGQLGSPVTLRDRDGDFRFAAGDMNQDGRSDLAGPEYTPPCGPGPCSDFLVLHGSSSRTFAQKVSANSAANYLNPVIADFNGDRLMDIAVIASDAASKTFGFRVAYQDYNSDTLHEGAYYALGSFTPDPGVKPTRFLLTDDYNRDMKPDLMTIGEQDDILYVVTNTTNMGGWAYNTTVGFPNCRQPGGKGLNICLPQQNGQYADFYTRVPMSAAASDYKPLRKLEVWVDGKKHHEQFYGFGQHVYYDDLDYDFTIGNHTATFYAVGYDNSLMSKSVSFSVFNGYDCGQSSTPATGVTICRPIQGSTVDSPTTITAVSGNSVTWMEIWEGGIKRKQGAEHSQEVTLTLGPGTHTATVFGKVGTTITDKKQVTFTVAGSGGGTCAPSSATTAVICSPAANSTVSSPVAVNAKGGSSVNYMEAWVDGVKKGNVNSNTLSLSVGLAAGQHRLTVYAKVNGTITDKQTEYFTVK